MDQMLFFAIVIIAIFAFYIIRIITLSRWLKTNVYMRKESNYTYSPADSHTDFQSKQEEEMRLRRHRLALRKARAGRPGHKI
ncbi:MAG: hypothetical protein JSV49_02375 [Thermoplasmata archaeon]|nr:MAG: hypothetical protein JSV49_02375 [Thermoplasmata archaeon]